MIVGDQSVLGYTVKLVRSAETRRAKARHARSPLQVYIMNGCPKLWKSATVGCAANAERIVAVYAKNCYLKQRFHTKCGNTDSHGTLSAMIVADRNVLGRTAKHVQTAAKKIVIKRKKCPATITSLHPTQIPRSLEERNTWLCLKCRYIVCQTCKKKEWPKKQAAKRQEFGSKAVVDVWRLPHFGRIKGSIKEEL